MGFHFGGKASADRPGRVAEEVASSKAVLVEFGERDAPACRLEAHVLSQLLSRYGDRLRVLHVDVRNAPSQADAYAVTAVPTFVLFVDGAETRRLVGFQSVEDLARGLDEALPSAP